MTDGTPSASVIAPQAWVDGALIPRGEARVSIDDFAPRYGAAAFETMLARHGRVFRLEAHLGRLEAGLRLMGVTAPPRDVLAQAVRETLAANGFAEAAVRLTVTAGHGGAPDLARASRPSTFVTADPLPRTPGPARLAVASVRLDERRAWREVKVSQYLPYLLARQEARALGADDALLLNHRDEVAEAATANLFLVLDEALVTPSLESGPLPGITRAAVLEVARAEGVAVAEATLRLDALMGAQAAFLTSSLGLRDVVAIEASAGAAGSGVDWHALAPAHPVVGRVRRAYERLVEQETGGGP